MKGYTQEYLQDVLDTVEENVGTDETVKAKIRAIFSDLEIEMRYIDQRRQEAEDALHIFIKNFSREENSKNYLNTDV